MSNFTEFCGLSHLYSIRGCLNTIANLSLRPITLLAFRTFKSISFIAKSKIFDLFRVLELDTVEVQKLQEVKVKRFLLKIILINHLDLLDYVDYCTLNDICMLST
jgi:hypothetical protein